MKKFIILLIILAVFFSSVQSFAQMIPAPAAVLTQAVSPGAGLASRDEFNRGKLHVIAANHLRIKEMQVKLRQKTLLLKQDIKSLRGKRAAERKLDLATIDPLLQALKGSEAKLAENHQLMKEKARLLTEARRGKDRAQAMALADEIISLQQRRIGLLNQTSEILRQLHQAVVLSNKGN